MDVGYPVLDVGLCGTGCRIRGLGLVSLRKHGLMEALEPKLTSPQVAVPVYSAWLAYSTFGNVKQMFGAGGGGGGGAGEMAEGTSSGAASKRQQKMEKRGGQKMQYR